jgi:hypothetical protein
MEILGKKRIEETLETMMSDNFFKLMPDIKS